MKSRRPGSLEILKAFDYHFPPELIAQAPVTPRDSAKLLVYNRKRKKAFWDSFRNLVKYLPPGAVLVLNKTKVIPARLEVRKETGGRVRLLFVRREGKFLIFLADRKLAVSGFLTLTSRIRFRVARQEQNFYSLEPSFTPQNILKVLNHHGRTPLPQYIKHSPLSEGRLRKEYQTIFAREAGSVAAPTASLHFTSRLLRAIRAHGHETYFLTLHVSLGTFAPVTSENLTSNTLHSEYYEIDRRTAQALNRAKRGKRPIVAVGTTVVRTLESAADASGSLRQLSGETRIFIRPGYHFQFVDALITNFHVPRSSLLMLVAAMIPRKILLKLYAAAIRRRFRLFSFGDGMLIR